MLIDWSIVALKVREVCNATRETTIEATATEQSPTSIGSRWFVVLAGERRIGWAGSEYTGAELRCRPRNHSSRRGSL
jgi:hypothetical protein